MFIQQIFIKHILYARQLCDKDTVNNTDMDSDLIRYIMTNCYKCQKYGKLWELESGKS